MKGVRCLRGAKVMGGCNRASRKRDKRRQKTRMRTVRQERKKSEIDSCPQKHNIKPPTSYFSFFLR